MTRAICWAPSVPLAPPREPIALQCWSIRRVGLACAVLAAIVAPVYISGRAFFPAGDIGVYPPVYGTAHSMILAAQAVPSAAQVPCISALSAGWRIGGADIASRAAPVTVITKVFNLLGRVAPGPRSATLVRAPALRSTTDYELGKPGDSYCGVTAAR